MTEKTQPRPAKQILADLQSAVKDLPTPLDSLSLRTNISLLLRELESSLKVSPQPPMEQPIGLEDLRRKIVDYLTGEHPHQASNRRLAQIFGVPTSDVSLVTQQLRQEGVIYGGAEGHKTDSFTTWRLTPAQ